MNFHNRLWSVSLIASVFALSNAHANIGEFTGFGGRTAALGGAAAAWGSDGYAAYANPAMLAIRSEQRFRLSYHMLFVTPRFTPITSVVTQNTVTADGINVSSVDTSYRDTFGQAVGASYQFLPYLWNLSLGITAFLPMTSTAYMDTGSAYTPEYINYRSRTQRPQVEIGLGVNPFGPIYIGAGMHVGFGLNSIASVFIQTAANTASSMKFASSLVPKASPYFSFLIAPEGDQSKWSVGAVARLSLVSDNNMYLRTSARAFGTLTALDFNFNAMGALYYDPTSFEVGGSWQILDWLRGYAQVDYVLWSAFQTAAMTIYNTAVDQCNGASCPVGIQIAPSANPNFAVQNIFVPRVGAEFTTGKHTIRAGYSYKPSILSSTPTNSANSIDPPAHRMSVGYGYEFSKFIGLDRPWNLNVHATWQALANQSITKATATDIGAPGYTAGGNLFGGGVSLSLAL